jgi:hypothetical protein
MQFLRHPYAMTVVGALLTSVIVYFYTKTTDPEPAPRQAFFKTLAASLAVGVCLTWVASRQAGGGDAAFGAAAAEVPFFTDPTVNFPSGL